MKDGNRKLSHWVHVVGKVLDEFLSFMRNSASGLHFFSNGLELFLSGEFTSHQKPEKTFWEGFLTTFSLGEVLDQIRDGESSEFDTLER